MAKTIRPIQCPQCGSTQKTPLAPDLFRCANCLTEYYLDSDDVTVNVRHHYPPAPAPPVVRPSLSWGQHVAIGLCALVGVGAVVWIVLLLNLPPNPHRAATPVAQPIFYLTNYLYADAQRQPVYVTLRTDAPRWGSDSTTWTAVFFDPRTDQVRREQELLPLGHHPDEHHYEWHTFPGGQVYLLANQLLYRVDARANRLVDVSQTLLASQPTASSGVAQFSFDASHEALRALTNEGQTLYYLPATGQLFTEGAALYRAADQQRPQPFFYFNQAFGGIRTASRSQLIRSRATSVPGQSDTDTVAIGRRFFDANVLYQDATTLLIVTSPTAREEGPDIVQRLDVRDGRVLWARPPSSFDFEFAVRTANGFALHYRSGREQDYVHGVLLLTDDGREIRNFQRRRME